MNFLNMTCNQNLRKRLSQTLPMGVIYGSVGLPSVGVWNPTVVDGFVIQLGGTLVVLLDELKELSPNCSLI